jgi:hypothetical protein
MTDSGELVNLAVVEQVILFLAVGLPVAGLLAGLAWGARCRRPVPGALQGFAAGLLGPTVWVLWRIYNAIEDHYGLDSVKALLINLALFVIIGVSLGTAIGWWRRRGEVESNKCKV